MPLPGKLGPGQHGDLRGDVDQSDMLHISSEVHKWARGRRTCFNVWYHQSNVPRVPDTSRLQRFVQQDIEQPRLRARGDPRKGVKDRDGSSSLERAYEDNAGASLLGSSLQ